MLQVQARLASQTAGRHLVAGHNDVPVKFRSLQFGQKLETEVQLVVMF